MAEVDSIVLFLISDRENFSFGLRKNSLSRRNFEGESNNFSNTLCDIGMFWAGWRILFLTILELLGDTPMFALEPLGAAVASGWRLFPNDSRRRSGLGLRFSGAAGRKGEAVFPLEKTDLGRYKGYTTTLIYPLCITNSKRCKEKSSVFGGGFFFTLM